VTDIAFAVPSESPPAPIGAVIYWAIITGLILLPAFHFIVAKQSFVPSSNGSFADDFARYGRHVAGSHCTSR
jgi:hypothetical protein